MNDFFFVQLVNAQANLNKIFPDQLFRELQCISLKKSLQITILTVFHDYVDFRTIYKGVDVFHYILGQRELPQCLNLIHGL